MTFIKLDEENFVNTKIINRFKVKYKNSDPSTFLYDNNIDSKSIIYNQPNTHGTFENSLLGLEDDDSLNNVISNFFNFANNKIDYTVAFDLEIKAKKNQYFLRKDILDKDYSVSVTNENLKAFNFKNAFKINRTTNSFLPCSFELSKFQTVKNNLYNFYKNDFSKDFYPELDYGFCNYNTINFFSQKYNSSRVHSNCIVYSNQKDSNDVNDVDFSKDFSINLWVNIRKDNSSNRGCIMHIPDVFSLYSVEADGCFRICITTGSDTKKTLNTQNFASVDFNNSNSQYSSNICLTDATTFLYNHWHNLTINFDNTRQDEYMISIYKNNELADRFNIEIVREKASAFNSFICLGNKPQYYIENDDAYNAEYEDIFYSFFGKNYLDFDNVLYDGPFYTKDLNLGTNTSYTDSKFINDIILDNKMIYFDDSIDNNSSFHGEINEVKIYSNSLEIQKIEELSKKTIKDIEAEVLNYSLSFYVPVYYLPINVKKVGLFNCKKDDINLYYNAIYNPFFANSSLGRDISVENYLVDFVKSKKPNVIISGFDKKNVYSNYYEKLHTDFIDNTTDFNKIKKGVPAEDIFLDKLESLPLDDDNKYNNISYRNLLILPNDNGIPEVRFDVIKYFMLNDTVFTKNINFFNSESQEKLYHIDCYNTLKYVDYQDNDRLGISRESVPGQDINLKINNNDIQIFSSKDTYFDISNYLYHDESLETLSDFSPSNIGLDNYHIRRQLDNFNNIFIETESNPINRNYNSDILTFRNNNIVLSDDLNYRYLPVPFYSINRNDISLFSIILDISTQYYNKKLKKGTIKIKDSNIRGSNGLDIQISDNKKGHLFRNDCLTKAADWNYVGHVFYKEGICAIHHTSLYTFGKSDFEFEFVSEGHMFVHETNIPIKQGMLNVSHNSTYNKELRLDESAFNSDELFVFITDVNIHDENLNIVAKAKMAHPIPKKNTDNLLIRLKMDY
jgi:hypothetical protein